MNLPYFWSIQKSLKSAIVLIDLLSDFSFSNNSGKFKPNLFARSLILESPLSIKVMIPFPKFLGMFLV